MKPSLPLPRLRQILGDLRRRAEAGAAGLPRVRLPRREVLLVAAAGILAAVVTLIVLVTTSNAQDRRASQQRLQQIAKPGAVTRSDTGGELSVDDFLLPSLHVTASIPDYYPFRPRLERWSRENAERFWVPPRRIAIEKIGAMNDRNVEQMFEKVK